MKAFIISYFGPNSDRRQRRVDYHQQQIDWLLENGFKKKDIYISCRKYQDTEFIKGINYSIRTGESGIKGIANSRNELLDIFYKTNDPWGLFLDNDSILDERNRGDIFEVIRKGTEFHGLGLFTPINPATPGRGAFNKIWEKDPVDDYWVFQQGTTSGKMFFMKNLPLFNYKECYFRPDVLAGEDILFGFEVAKQGLNPAWCHNIVINELAKKVADEMVWKSKSDATTRQEYNLIYKDTAVELYPAMRIESGKLRASPHFKMYKVPTRLVFPKKKIKGLFSK